MAIFKTNDGQRVIRRLARFGGRVDVCRDRLVIRLPNLRLLALVARAVLLAAAILSFPWLHAVASRAGAGSQPAGDGSLLPALLRGLTNLGALGPESRAVFVGEAASNDLPLLVENRIDPVSGDRLPSIAAGSLDFVLAADGLASGFESIDRALKVGGITALRLEPTFRLPANYRIVHFSGLGSPIVAMRKLSQQPSVSTPSTGRRLLSVPESKKEALKGLEGVALEPPARGRPRRWKTKYLPDLMGEFSLDRYPRRLFVDVGPAGGTESGGWFKKQYPSGNQKFEMIRVDVVGEAGPSGSAAGGMAEWLGRNVREEEYVVMKAEAEVVEEVVKGGAIGLVDELFLECPNQWTNGRRGARSGRAYWECLVLYGRLKDEGVAVHQWWG